jgi:hypothetical protein
MIERPALREVLADGSTANPTLPSKPATPSPPQRWTHGMHRFMQSLNK